jgi:Rha family phage regulatory protein
MNNLTIIERKGQFVADSREVAEMTRVRHADLLEKIDGYIVILNQNGEFRSDLFFIESSYQAGTGKDYKRYDITRKGCDMVANKMTGEKGVLFTAAYVTKFEEMERSLKVNNLPQNYKEALLALVAQVEQNEQLETEKLILQQQVAEYEPKASYVDQILHSINSVTTTQIAKDYGLSGKRLNIILHEESIQYKINGQWLLYAKYQNCGYTKSKTIEYFGSDGERRVKMNTQWTQKGRLFIHEILQHRGIIPFMDRKSGLNEWVLSNVTS